VDGFYQAVGGFSVIFYPMGVCPDDNDRHNAANNKGIGKIMIQFTKLLSIIFCFVMLTILTGAHEAQCDIQADVKIMPKNIKIGKITSFKAKVKLPKGYDLRSWTITSITCGNAWALPENIKKRKHHIIASFSTQDLLYVDDGRMVLTVIVTAENNDQMVIFTGSDIVRFRNYAEAAVSCESLVDLHINAPDFHQPLEISTAELVPAGPTMPEYCKVSAAVGNDGFELRLPTKTWGGKLLHQGGGGNCGVITTSSADDQLQRGYATVGTNAGHDSALTGRDARWGYDQEFNDEYGDAYEREIDYGYRAVHVTTVAAKLITKRFYNKRLKYSYFRGCSTGGRQGLMEAQRYPKDFDGIIAGDPPFGFTGLSVIFHGWPAWVNRDAEGELVLSNDKVTLIKETVYEACDGLDGVIDGVISDPRVCTWDPLTSEPSILCEDGEDTPDCLTIAEANVVQKLYDAPRDIDGNVIYPGGRPRGTEGDWSGLLGSGCRTCGMAEGNLQYLMFQPDPGPTYSIFDFPCTAEGCDLTAVEELSLYAPIYNATSIHLERFKRLGGKMIMYGGWATSASHPYALVDYYERVRREIRHTKSFFRLYMIPGMGHCGRSPGNIGPNNTDFDQMFPQLEKWVEKHIAPREVVSTALKTSVPTRTRLLCPHPMIAKYKGEEYDSDKAESYICTEPDYPLPPNEWDSIDGFPWDSPFF
jgi:feruloyl esterase